MTSTRIRVAVWIGCFCLLACTSVLGQDICDGVSTVNNTTLKSVAVVTGVPGRPLFVSAPPGDTDRIFIVDQNGLIYLKKRGTPPSDFTTFLDITDRVFASNFENEAGLLGLAFDPDYASNGFFYVNYNDSTGAFFCSDCETVVSRFTVSADPDVGDPTSEVELMRFPQPQSNHNGGQVVFGPDDFLYIFTGDGGGGNDDDPGHGTCGNGQNLETLLGKILRIDVNGIDPQGTAPDTACMTGFTGANYTVPSDNPFVDGANGNCDENWAYGLRNPWRNDFDRATGDLYVADVGQLCWEEVNYVEAASAGGQNYGWRQMEGENCFDHNNAGNCDPPNVPCAGSPDCNDPSLTNPVSIPGILPYGHAEGCSVTGGHVYRGCRMPNFSGIYFYGDFCDGFIRSFEIVDGVPANSQDWSTELDPAGNLINALTSFGVDAQGEIYIVDRGGEILKIMPPFTDFQVSGAGAADQFLLNKNGNWSWEDLEFSTMHPVDYYQVYRGVPNGVFDCIHSTTEATWPEGDPTVPNSGELLAYLVTAVSGGEETRSGDPERTLGAACSPPALF